MGTGSVMPGVTAYAETQAIRPLSLDWRVVNPSLRADSGPLRGATLYTTVEPCAMCAWAICIAGMSELVIGAPSRGWASATAATPSSV